MHNLFINYEELSRTCEAQQLQLEPIPAREVCVCALALVWESEYSERGELHKIHRICTGRKYSRLFVCFCVA